MEFKTEYTKQFDDILTDIENPSISTIYEMYTKFWGAIDSKFPDDIVVVCNIYKLFNKNETNHEFGHPGVLVIKFDKDLNYISHSLHGLNYVKERFDFLDQVENEELIIKKFNDCKLLHNRYLLCPWINDSIGKDVSKYLKNKHKIIDVRL